MTRAPSLGIVTALACEYAAMAALIEERFRLPVAGDANHYHVGRLPSALEGHPHEVVLTFLPQDGTKNASVVCTDLLRSFPSVRCVVMVGIAGGVPALDRPAEHVRLGDIVVADGIVDYDHVRTIAGNDHLRRPIAGPSHTLLRAAQELRAKTYLGVRPWEQWLDTAIPDRTAFARPPDDADIVYVDGVPVAHPPAALSGHTQGRPKVHHGIVGSADRLLRDALRRDTIAAAHRILAIEMEGSGIAASSALHDRPWFVVRGIADYCDDVGKNDRWHPYASLAAAAYTRALLAETPPLTVPDGPATNAVPPTAPTALDRRSVRPDTTERFGLVDLLLDIPAVQEDRGRQFIVEQLPFGSVIRRHPAPRLDAYEILRTTLDYAQGPELLVNAITHLAGDSTPVARFVVALRTLLK